MDSESTAPWQSEECFPVKPAGADFGYLESGKFVPCSKEELAARVAGLKRPEIDLVWHPDAPRLTPVWTVRFLGDALRQREKAVLLNNRRVAAFNSLFFCVFSVMARNHGGAFAMVAFFAFFLGFLPLYQSWRELRRLDSTEWDFDSPATAMDRYSAWVETRSSTMTRWLLGILAAAGLAQLLARNANLYWVDAHGAMESARHSVAAAGLVKDAVWHGEVWRLFTAALLHGGMIHFIFNATALFSLGRLMEALAGRERLAAVFGLSALMGNVLSLLAAPHGVAVGASGGLLGLLGFLLVLGLKRKAFLPPGFARAFGLNLALVAAMGVAGWSMVDNAAHLGGFATGATMAALMIPDGSGLPLPETARSRAAGGIAFGMIIASAALAIFKTLV